MTDFPQGVRECREPELGLEELLRHRCQLLQQHEEYQVRGAAGTPSSSTCGAQGTVSVQGSKEEGWWVTGFH